ncbi:MAG TPA: polysaccharide deacetylase family protein [Gaiellaceae bacterium]|nr:polysaccharide deacetylase family protein [Gaiellaceae bacterium]
MSDVLVLCYHAVSERWPAELAVTPAALDEQLRSLLARGYRFATFHEAVSAPPTGRVVAVTFDDGYRSVLDAAFPVLSGLGVPATVFVCTDFVDRGGAMSWRGISDWAGGPYASELAALSWAELRTLGAAGWEVGSHTRTHPFLTALADGPLEDELVGSRARCEEALGVPCRSLAYPYGDFDARVVERAAAAGYTAACALPTRASAAAPLAWPRAGVYRRDGRVSFRLKTSPTLRRLRALPGGPALDRVYRAWPRRRPEPDARPRSS